MALQPSRMRPRVATYAKQAEATKAVDFVLNIIPDSVVGARRGDMLQVLLFAVCSAFRCRRWASAVNACAA